MELISKSDVALMLIKKASENEAVEISGVLGKKAFQKCLYFLNQHDNFFKFKWGDYGPFSEEIQQIAEDLEAGGNIIVKNIPTQKQGIFFKNMKFSEEKNANFLETKFPQELEKDIMKVTKFASGKKPRELELLASVHYWAKKQKFLTDRYDAKYLHEKLLELKPDAGFKLKDIENAINTLEYNEYLKK